MKQQKKRLFLFFFLMGLSSSILSCSVYKSADRNNFESEVPTFKIKSLQKMSCSAESVSAQASASRLLTTVNDEFIWQYEINDMNYFESTNLKGTYCFYDVTFE